MKTGLYDESCPHCSMLSTILFSIGTPDSKSTIFLTTMNNLVVAMDCKTPSNPRGFTKNHGILQGIVLKWCLNHYSPFTCKVTVKFSEEFLQCHLNPVQINPLLKVMCFSWYSGFLPQGKLTG